jgi:hypothetical protein
MQCPECRSETPGSLGRCTRCDAVLPQADEVSPWSSTPAAGSEPWPPEPWQPEPVREEGEAAGPTQVDRPWAASDDDRPWGERPPARPWEQQPQERSWGGPPPQEQPWGGQPDDRPWGPSSSQERPWGGQPEEPRPWSDGPQEQRWGAPPQGRPWGDEQGRQPWDGGPERQGPPRNDGEQWLPDEGSRWRGPLIAGLVAALLTAAIVVGYVFWTKDDADDPLAGPGTSQKPVPSAETPSGTGQEEEPAGAGDPQAEAAKVDALLSDMSSSRKKLANISYTCARKSQDISAFETAIQEREEQLSRAEKLSLSSLENGAEIKEALVKALQASIESNQEALTWLQDEDGCDKDAAARLKDVTDRATDTKRAFLELWNPVAADQGLPTWTRETI